MLDLSVIQARKLFENHLKITHILDTLIDVGLSYVKLEQAATTMSGGEAQRIKLARELTKRDTGDTLYILDEPTTGLHFQEVRMLLAVLQRLRFFYRKFDGSILLCCQVGNDLTFFVVITIFEYSFYPMIL